MKLLTKILGIPVLFLCFGIMSCNDDNNDNPAPAFEYNVLKGSNETPPNSSTGTGTVTATFDNTTKVFSVSVSYSGLPALTAAHIHKGAIGVKGDPVFVPADLTANPLIFNETLDAAQEADLKAGLYYVNLHTAAFPDGEIRAQIKATINNGTFEYNVLKGSNETPPNSSTGTGTVTATFDNTTKAFSVSVAYSGLPALTAAHIHKGAIGVKGDPVFVPADLTANPLIFNETLDAGQEADLKAGLYYVNLHTANFPDGEIRAQIKATVTGQPPY